MGALKLRNLLQIDQFEEDLNISRVRLEAPPRVKPSPAVGIKTPPMDPEELQRKRAEVAQKLAQLRASL